MRALKITLLLAALGFVVYQASAASGRPFHVTMNGASEVPGPGDADGSGVATLTVNPGTGEICYKLEVQDIAPATAAHIHRGSPDEAGPVVVPLTPPTDGDSDDCITVDIELARAIVRDPGEYYVNVHNANFPGGAIRGQLGVH